MKKYLILIPLLIITISFSACVAPQSQSAVAEGKDIIAPYTLSKYEARVLGAFGIDPRMEVSSGILSFHMPDKTKRIDMNLYTYEKGIIMEDSPLNCSSGIIGNVDPNGLFTININNDDSITCGISTTENNEMGSSTFTFPANKFGEKNMTSIVDFLPAEKRIDLEKEIVVGVIKHDSRITMEGEPFADASNPASFAEYDYAQVIGITFSEKDITEHEDEEIVD